MVTLLNSSFQDKFKKSKKDRSKSQKIKNSVKKDGRLPPTYFAPSNFVKDAFQKDDSVFFSQNTKKTHN